MEARPTHADGLPRVAHVSSVYRAAGDLIEGGRGREEKKKGKKKKEKGERKKKSRRDACAAAVTAAATVAFVGQWNTVPVVAITSTAALAAVHQAASTRLATRAPRAGYAAFERAFRRSLVGEQSSSNCVRVSRSLQLSSWSFLGIVSVDQCSHVKRPWSIFGRVCIERIIDFQFSRYFFPRIFIPRLLMY